MAEKKKQEEGILQIQAAIDKTAVAPDPAKLLVDWDTQKFQSVATEPLDSTDPNIYSHQLVISPFSFLDPKTRKYKATMPPPTYLKESQVAYPLKFVSQDILKGLEQPADGGLRIADKEILSKQKGVLISLLAQAAKSLLQGGSFVRISLPVRVFEARSTLDKIIDAWRMAPTYLTRAADQKDPALRMKDVIAFVISGIYCSITQLKPFNPLLGETLEGGLDDGTQIYCEHTSHHPPISTFLIHGAQGKYTMYGSYEYKAHFGANSIKGCQSGLTTIEFADGGVITFKLPTLKMTGLVVGTRLVYYVDTMEFYYKKNGLKATIIFDPGKSTGIFSSRKKGTKRDEFLGLLYHWNTDLPAPKKVINKLTELTDVRSEICKIAGSWLTSLRFGDEEYWNIQTGQPCKIWYSKNPLPSDWRFREDLIWLRRSDIPKADTWKLDLEVQQRHDRALREKFHKHKQRTSPNTLQIMNGLLMNKYAYYLNTLNEGF